MSIRTTRSVLLEQDKDKISVCGNNCKYVVNEILDFMKDEHIRKYYEHFELYERSLDKCELLDVLLKVKDKIKEIEEDLDINIMNTVKK